MTQHQPPPQPPPPELPLPPHIADIIAQLRETVEVQARTIKLLIANYESLLATFPAGQGPVVVSAMPPLNPLTGTLWWDGTNLQVWDGTAWQIG